MNLEALKLSVTTTEASEVEKQILWRKARKIFRHIEDGNQEEIARLSPLFLYRWCCARLQLKDFSDYTGWEWRDDEGVSARLLFEEHPIPRWKGQYVKTLRIFGEQGVGDEIFWASLIPECLARVDEVIYECDPRLHSIIERSFPRTHCIPRVPRAAFDWGIKAEAFIPAGDLLRIFRRSVGHFPAKPYLKAERRESLRQYTGRVGVAFKGRQGSINPVDLGIERPLSVQYGTSVSGIETPELDLTNDLEGVFALVSVLDRVVTVPQSIQHIAGSLGVPVDIIMPTRKGEIINTIPWDYYPRGGSLPWYPKAVCYRTVEDWRDRIT